MSRNEAQICVKCRQKIVEPAPHPDTCPACGLSVMDQGDGRQRTKPEAARPARTWLRKRAQALQRQRAMLQVVEAERQERLHQKAAERRKRILQTAKTRRRERLQAMLEQQTRRRAIAKSPGPQPEPPRTQAELPPPTEPRLLLQQPARRSLLERVLRRLWARIGRESQRYRQLLRRHEAAERGQRQPDTAKTPSPRQAPSALHAPPPPHPHPETTDRHETQDATPVEATPYQDAAPQPAPPADIAAWRPPTIATPVDGRPEKQLVEVKVKSSLEANGKTMNIDLPTLTPGELLRLRDTKPFKTYVPYTCQARKSVFDLVAGDSHLEIRFAKFLDRCADVVSFAKIHGFSMKYWRDDGSASSYLPDFVVKTSDERVYIVETKGWDDPNERNKMERLKQWRQGVNHVEGENRFDFVFVDAKRFGRSPPESFSGLVARFRKYKEEND